MNTLRSIIDYLIYLLLDSKTMTRHQVNNYWCKNLINVQKPFKFKEVRYIFYNFYILCIST